LVEKSNPKIPDFRYTKTKCTSGYNYWLNNVNDLRYTYVTMAFHVESRVCWIFHNDVRFSQPYLPYGIMIFLDIFIFIVGLFFF